MQEIAEPLAGSVALVTGANHGVGAATAFALAEKGADVAVSYWRVEPEDRDDEYQRMRAADGSEVAEAIATLGRRCHPIEADLTDPAAPAALFAEAERELGAVRVLVHNASGWRKDSFAADGTDVVGRQNHPVTPDSIDLQFDVDAKAGALLMNEFIARHRDRGDDWGRIVTLLDHR